MWIEETRNVRSSARDKDVVRIPRRFSKSAVTVILRDFSFNGISSQGPKRIPAKNNERRYVPCYRMRFRLKFTIETHSDHIPKRSERKRARFLHFTRSSFIGLLLNGPESRSFDFCIFILFANCLFVAWFMVDWP